MKEKYEVEKGEKSSYIALMPVLFNASSRCVSMRKRLPAQDKQKKKRYCLTQVFICTYCTCIIQIYYC